MSKQAGLSVAIGLVGVGIILHALPKLGFGPAAALAAPAPNATTALAGGAGPTIVWYGVGYGQSEFGGVPQASAAVFRAWSDGTLEMKRVRPVNGSIITGACEGLALPCTSPWFVISSPSDGLSAAADSNFDSQVDGADLANLLAAWGPAPRSPIPPSDCPLDLLNP